MQMRFVYAEYRVHVHYSEKESIVSNSSPIPSLQRCRMRNLIYNQLPFQPRVLIFTSLPCNTPILTIKKKGKFDSGENQRYWSVQDWRVIHSFVIPHHPGIPNSPTILTSIPIDVSWLPVLDLCSAYLSLSLHQLFLYLHFKRDN